MQPITPTQFKQMQSDIKEMKQLLLRMSGIKTNDWIGEDEVMMMTTLSKRSLFNLRKEGKIRSTSSTGRKIKYNRKDVEEYINNQ